MWIACYGGPKVNLALANRLYINGVRNGDTKAIDYYEVRVECCGRDYLISGWDTEAEAMEVIDKIASDLQCKPFEYYFPTTNPPLPSQETG